MILPVRDVLMTSYKVSLQHHCVYDSDLKPSVSRKAFSLSQFPFSDYVCYLYIACNLFIGKISMLFDIYLHNVSFSFYFSPSSLTGKKSNEIILGGLNSLKSAATTVVKKFDEIKEAISATSTPVKNKEREQKIAYGISHESLDSLTDGSIQDRNETRASGRKYKLR